METYMTVKEVAVKVRLSEQTIRRYTMLKQIPFHKIVRAVRYKPSEIEQWIEERETQIVETVDVEAQYKTEGLETGSVA
jgi:excisionase family DNA binding protein